MKECKQCKKEKKEARYWPRHDRPWYELRLENMTHQHQEAANEQHRRETAKKGEGPLMEKYRAKHEYDFMQQHDCGRGDCPDHEEKPLGWDFI